NITVTAPEFKGRLKKVEDINIVRFHLMKIRFGDIYFSIPKKMKRLVADADIIFNQTIGPIGASAIKNAKRQGKPIVSYVHSIEWELASKSVKRFKKIVEWWVKKRAKRLYNKCNLILVPSREVGYILTANGVRTRKKIIKLGVNTNRFVPARDEQDKFAVRKKLNLPTDKIHKIIIGFCGRIGREKDLPTLYSAFKNIIKTNQNIVLLIVGEGVDIREMKRDKNVILAGSVNNVVPYLQAMDIYVLPSLTETSSLSTLEAMSCALPVVVTPVGSIKEYIVDGKNGLIFPPGDVLSLTKKLRRLIYSEKLRTDLGISARETTMGKYEWSKTVEEIYEVLSEL
ncbi:MAG: glycosyltransferase family 4 protein, partial [Nanoarchaeota archaeon]